MQHICKGRTGQSSSQIGPFAVLPSCDIECTLCGACCVAPDIASLGKAAGVRCPHLLPDLKCAIYEDRPLVCRQYKADETCLDIEAPTLEERVAKYQSLFGLQGRT